MKPFADHLGIVPEEFMSWRDVIASGNKCLLLVEGELLAEIDGEKQILQAGDVCIIPAGKPHCFENQSQNHAVTFNVYSPPEYPPGEKG